MQVHFSTVADSFFLKRKSITEVIFVCFFDRMCSPKRNDISLQNSVQVVLYTNKNVEVLTHDSILKLECETRYVILQNKYPHNLIDPTAQFTHPKPNQKKLSFFLTSFRAENTERAHKLRVDNHHSSRIIKFPAIVWG